MKMRIALWVVGLAIFVGTQAHAAMPSTPAPRRVPSDAGPAKLGSVDFQISCDPGVRDEFNRGVALLHSFWHDQAFLAFENVASSNPDCAIAYWGEAMTHFHQLLATPTAADIQAGTAELAQADRARQKTPREVAYIHVLHLFFDGYRSEKYLPHASAYADAMAALANSNPHDLEAQVFYALALLAADPPGDIRLVNPKKAVAILEPLFRTHPNHPGIAHYIIHACDNPRMAREGLSAARHYAQIAPQVPHALHMPAHIFVRLGLWQDDIDSNLASKAVSEAAGLHQGAEHRLHAMEFLEYAYLQTGRFDEAKAIIAEAGTVQPTDVDHRYPDMWASVQARYPALLAIETANWTMAEHLITVPNGGFATLSTLLARAEAAAHLHDTTAASDTQTQLDSLTSKESEENEIAFVIEIHSWVNFARGNLKGAVALLRPLADRQAKTGKGEVEIPAREMLADMLLLSGKPAEALAQFQKSLLSDPNRFNVLLGAGESAEKLGRNRLAASYYRTLISNCPHADGAAVDELRHAKSILSGH